MIPSFLQIQKLFSIFSLLTQSPTYNESRNGFKGNGMNLFQKVGEDGELIDLIFLGIFALCLVSFAIGSL